MSSSVDQIKSKIDIVSLVSSYIKLEKAGANFKGRCPFHNEKTPSFFVSPDRGSYYCFGCFPPGQLVKTPFGHHKIETLDKNHFVVSGNGMIRKILAVMERDYQGKLVNITTKKLGGVVSMTTDHKVLVVRPKTSHAKKTKQFYRQIRDYTCVIDEGKPISLKQLERYGVFTEMVAGDIKKDDFLLYPISQVVTEISKINLSEYQSTSSIKGPKPKSISEVKITDEFLKLIGYYIAEGSNHRAYIRFSLGNHEEDFASEIIELIWNIFGLKAKIHRRTGHKTGIEVTACHTGLASIFSNLCGKGALNKHIPFIFQELHPTRQMILLNAICKGDGYTSKKRLSKYLSSSIHVVSQILIEQLADVLLRNGIFPSTRVFKKRIDKDGTHHKESYVVTWSSTARSRHHSTFQLGNVLYWLVPIREITTTFYRGPVFNLTVDQDHTYIARNFAVGNCQAKGDIFTFVQEFEGLDFVGSLKVLADRAGVVLEQYNRGEKTEKEKLHSVLEQAVFFYQKNLTDDRAALKYLHDRGVTDETIKEFRIGFAPAEWRDLFEYLLSRGVTEGDMLDVGLIKKKENQDQSYQNEASVKSSYYDTFRGRIMFSINDSSGRVVGFSGRVLVADEPSINLGQANAPKYLNSPETTLFNKSEILFGLDKAKKDIRLKDYSILVEGQMDLIMLHQVGITNTVASSGTALSEKHLIKLQRLSNRIIMAYDADPAGFSASNRSSQLALSLGMDLKLASFPEGKDPADLAKEDLKKLKDCFKKAKHIIDFYTDALLEKNLPARELGKEIQKNVLAYVAILPSSIEQAHFIKSIAQKTFIKEEALWDDLKQIGHVDVIMESKTEKLPPPKRIESIERKVMGIIMWQKEGRNRQEDINLVEMEKRAKKIFGKKMLELQTKYQKEKDLILFEIESYYNGKIDLIKDIEELLSGLEEEYLKEEFFVAMGNLQKAEQSKNAAQVSYYLAECQRISQRINEIKNESR